MQTFNLSLSVSTCDVISLGRWQVSEIRKNAESHGCSGDKSVSHRRSVVDVIHFKCAAVSNLRNLDFLLMFLELGGVLLARDEEERPTGEIAKQDSPGEDVAINSRIVLVITRVILRAEGS